MFRVRVARSLRPRSGSTVRYIIATVVALKCYEMMPACTTLLAQPFSTIGKRHTEKRRAYYMNYGSPTTGNNTELGVL
jgi:hypothetical protein